MKAANWDISGMHCDSCAQTIKALLDAEPGVKATEVSYPAATARVLYDAALTDEVTLAAAVQRAGFKVHAR